MKKIITLLLICVGALSAHAQISSFPYNQGFENPLQNTGVNAVIYPNWTASEASYGTRIFSDSLNPRTGGRALAAIATSSFTATLTVALNLTGISNMTMNTWAKSIANGTGDRQAIVYCSTSIDGGATWSPATQLGDSTSFPNNSSTSYANYTYVFPFSTNNQSNVLLKIEVTRGLGITGGTAARFVMDDFTLDASSVDVTPPTVLSAKATGANSVQVTFSEPVGSSGLSASSYLGLGSIANTSQNGVGDVITLDLTTALVVGQIYTLTVGNVSDLAGNTMANTQNFTIVYNENTGNIRFTEIMYNNPGNDSLEYLEIKNLDNHAINIGGWHFSNGVQGFFPSGMTLQAGAYVVFAKYPLVANSFYQITSYGWDPTSSLNNAGEGIAFSNSADVIIDSLTYGISTPWDSIPNGQGPSLTLCNESANNHVPANWTHSLDFRGMFFGGTNTDSIFGTPGTACITVGLTEHTSPLQLSAWPNPVKDLFTISVSMKQAETAQLVIRDVAGRIVDQSSRLLLPGMNQLQLNTLTLASGYYLLSIETGSPQPTTLHFVKQ